ncbi:MAG TPA: hypothetical protein DHW71_00610 [Gammaproteobacteria bacterium]|nr:hypothetical protein [Gammaproteobacteria bacterium]HCK91450.1 hypothetical protein [Gammaproteobacteria bacterium]|tara:strand:- start:1959 stop:3224 length:1266 start_codon:yes stop_codon:yes gene_type:complete
MNNKNNGQIIIPGLFFIFIVTLMVIIIFNTSQEEYEKQQATNIADAAVYSALSYEANRLNYLAYTNRAVITNQVAAGQIMAVASWTDYSSQASRTLAASLSWVPYLGAALDAYAQVLESTHQSMQVILPAYVKMTDIAIQTLSTVQHSIKATTTAEIPLIVKKTIELNDDRFEISDYGMLELAMHTYAWTNFLSDADENKDLERQAIFINSVKDDWTEARSNQISLPATLIGALSAKLKQRGSSRLIRRYDEDGNPYWNWESRDSISLHTRKIKRLRTKRYEVGLVATDYSTDSTPFYGFFSENKNAERMGKGQLEEWSGLYSGLKSLHELNDKTTLSLALEVQIDSKELTLTHQNDSQAYGKEHNAEYASVAKGELFFQRSFDNRQEYASLYNPFWTAHLIDASDEKKKAWAFKGFVRPF